MRLEQSITVDIGEGGGEIEHLFLREIKAVPEFLDATTGIFHKKVEVLSLELVQTAQFLFKLVDCSQPTATVCSKEGLSVAVFNPKAFPQCFYSVSQFLDLTLATLLLIEQFLPFTD